MKQQLTVNQKGEIEFRKKLYLQQVEEKKVLDDELDALSIKSILSGRMERTRNQMFLFQKKDIALSPYIEIGAERCQRSLVMENDLGIKGGAALDISFDMLKSCGHYQGVFNKAKPPVRICCDANNLPFRAASVPFVFCYETLHHFPDPAPITKEVYRVLLPGGYFFFDEEPYKKVLHFNLYRGKKIYSKESLAKNKLKFFLDYFFSARQCNEVEHGIIENEDLSLTMWKQALAYFDEKKVQLKSLKFLLSDLFYPSSYLIYFAAYLFGGNISGICRKSGTHECLPGGSILDLLICPSCRELGSEVLLSRENPSFICPECFKTYPVIDQVLFLFSYGKFKELYPDIFKLSKLS